MQAAVRTRTLSCCLLRSVRSTSRHGSCAQPLRCIVGSAVFGEDRAHSIKMVDTKGHCTLFTTKGGNRGLFEGLSISPRDGRLLLTSAAHVAVRENYFLFRFPPFAGVVRHDRVMLLADDSPLAAKALQQRLASLCGLVSAERPFEHLVLESVLREDTLHKQDRFARLSQLVRATIASASGTGESALLSSSWLLDTQREAALYRLMTLSKSLGALALDVKRVDTALATLLASDEDMAGTYLSSRHETGAPRSLEDHTLVEELLESFEIEIDDLADRIAQLQESIATHRTLEQVKLSNERNRIMRLELLLSFGTTSLALCAAVAGFFGMNLHSGVDDYPNGLWLVTSAASTTALAVFAGLMLSVRRFHVSQGQQVVRTASLERSLNGLDAAYFALRPSRMLAASTDVDATSATADAVDERLPASEEPLVITKAALREALGRVQQAGGKPSLVLLGRAPHQQNLDFDELWALLDANGDGVLCPDDNDAVDQQAAESGQRSLPY